MSTVTPPPHDAAELPPAPPERRCPRCGSALAPDQEWCLACGAAAETEVAEPRGWRVPILLAAGLVALLVIGVIVLIIALANGPEKLGANPTPTPSAAVPVAPTPTPTLAPTVTVSPGATPTTTPGATITPSPTTTTPTPATTPATSFPGWTGGDGWTIIIESATSQAKAEDVAQQAQAAGETVGILKSDDYSSLNAGYWVVFSGTYATKKDAEANLDGVRAKHKDAYVRQVKA